MCRLCGGEKKPGTTTFTADLGFGVVVIRNIPATLCSLCGADWIPDEVAGRIEALVDEARQKRPPRYARLEARLLAQAVNRMW